MAYTGVRVPGTSYDLLTPTYWSYRRVIPRHEASLCGTGAKAHTRHGLARLGVGFDSLSVPIPQ